jgi:hypothetical protein
MPTLKSTLGAITAGSHIPALTFKAWLVRIMYIHPTAIALVTWFTSLSMAFITNDRSHRTTSRTANSFLAMTCGAGLRRRQMLRETWYNYFCLIQPPAFAGRCFKFGFNEGQPRGWVLKIILPPLFQYLLHVTKGLELFDIFWGFSTHTAICFYIKQWLKTRHSLERMNSLFTAQNFEITGRKAIAFTERHEPRERRLGQAILHRFFLNRW